MKLKVPGKPVLAKIPHYYICIEDEKTKKKFLIITSNIFNLMSFNYGVNDVKRLDPPQPNLPFLYKTSYILFTEIFVLVDVDIPETKIKGLEAFDNFDLNQMKSACKDAKEYFLRASDIEIL